MTLLQLLPSLSSWPFPRSRTLSKTNPNAFGILFGCFCFLSITLNFLVMMQRCNDAILSRTKKEKSVCNLMQYTWFSMLPWPSRDVLSLMSGYWPTRKTKAVTCFPVLVFICYGGPPIDFNLISGTCRWPDLCFFFFFFSFFTVRFRWSVTLFGILDTNNVFRSHRVWAKNTNKKNQYNKNNVQKQEKMLFSYQHSVVRNLMKFISPSDWFPSKTFLSLTCLISVFNIAQNGGKRTSSLSITYFLNTKWIYDDLYRCWEIYGS